MHFLVILCIPLLMLADYYLTLYGARLRQLSGYGQFFGNEEYELNPNFQADISNFRRLSRRHLIAVLFMLFALALFAALSNTDPIVNALFELFMGYLFVLYLTIIGKHLQNLLTFRYLQSHPTEVNGQVSINYFMSLKLSQYQLVTVLLPLLIVAWVTQSLFAIGGVCGLLGLTVYHNLWGRLYRARMHRQARATQVPQGIEPSTPVQK